MVEQKALDRFFTKFSPEPNSGCWLWTHGLHGNGYPGFWYKGKNYTGHRFAYEALVGPIPAGMQIMHSCDTPSCVNPDHLRPGTQTENNLQAVAQGRMGFANAKLTREQVREIRLEHSRGATRADLARKYGVRDTTMGMVVNRKTWKDVS